MNFDLHNGAEDAVFNRLDAGLEQALGKVLYQGFGCSGRAASI